MRRMKFILRNKIKISIKTSDEKSWKITYSKLPRTEFIKYVDDDCKKLEKHDKK